MIWIAILLLALATMVPLVAMLFRPVVTRGRREADLSLYRAQLARDLRRLVRERVAAGEDQAAVINFVHQRYGDFVLLRPPVTVATMLLWATPVLALGGGIAVIMFRRRRAMAEAAALSPDEAKRLAELDRGAA